MKDFKIIDASFIKSAQALGDSLGEDISEVVFLGRSNVGKSSTINGLTMRKNLAKSSSTPGKTRLINFFTVVYRYGEEDFSYRLVDLPGFGFAKVSKDMKNAWQKNLVEFIRKRSSIRIFIHLRDARHPHTQIDKEVDEFVKDFIRPDQLYLNVFTKMDKLNLKEKTALKKEFNNMIMISNVKHSGYDMIHKKIFSHVFGLDI
ncbi:MAG: GTP-binding protein [Sulfurovum sp. AS07-7]|nr:MAG: GTP-binding protein [Sulfurovum sp. AS07-7]